jgi:hypothetical protein
VRYLITWVTYGTHLPGDPRGTVDATHNTPNTRLADPKARRHELAQASLTATPYLLSSEARPVAIEALNKCANTETGP